MKASPVEELRQVTRYAQLRPWDMELIPLAEQISNWRAEYSAGIAEDMADTCKQFLPEFSLTFSFQRGWEKETDYELQLPARQRVFHRRTVSTNAEIRLVRAVRGVGQHTVALEASL